MLTQFVQLSSCHSVAGGVGTHQELRLFRVIKAASHFKTSSRSSWTTCGHWRGGGAFQGGQSSNKALAGRCGCPDCLPTVSAHTRAGRPACFLPLAAQNVNMLQRTTGSQAGQRPSSGPSAEAGGQSYFCSSYLPP